MAMKRAPCWSSLTASWRWIRHYLRPISVGVLTIIILGGGIQWYQTEQRYQQGLTALAQQDWTNAHCAFQPIVPYRDSLTLLKEGFYRPAITAIAAHQWDQAATHILGLEGVDREPSYRDLADQIAMHAPLATAVAQQRERAWQHGPWRIVDTLDAGDTVNCLTFSPDGTLLAIGTGSGAHQGTFQIVHLTPTIARTWFWRSRPADWQTFSPDGRWIAIESMKTELWAVDRHTPVVTIEGRQAVFSPTQPVLAAITPAGQLGLWNVPDGTLHTPLAQTSSPSLVVTFSPDGQRLVTIQQDHTIAVWQTQDLRLLQILHHPQQPVNLRMLIRVPPAISSDGMLLATNVSQPTIHIWNMHTGKLLHTLQDAGTLKSLAFRPGSHQLAVGRSTFSSHPYLGTLTSSAVVLWNGRTGQRLATFGETPMSIEAVWSPDGTILVTKNGSNGHGVRFWRPVVALPCAP